MRTTLATTLVLIVSGCAGVKSPSNQSGAGGSGFGGNGGSIFGPYDGGSGGTYVPPPTDGGTTSSDGNMTYTLAGTITSDVPTTLTVGGKPMPVVHLTLKLNDGTMPAKVTWTVDDTAAGSVGSDGVFTPNGYVGGVVTVTATAGGQGDAQFKWLYPYDGTVFPRGLAAPILQFGGTGTRATYTKITAPHFSYQQVANINDPLQVTIPPAIWKGLTLTAGPKDKVVVSVNKLAGNVGSGPVTQSWIIATATINGVFYYNTYTGSMLAGGGGGIMRIPAGQDAQLVVKGCTVCHSISANGNVMAAGSQNAPNAAGDWNPVTSQTYDLNTSGAATMRAQSNEGRLFSFVGLTPDGSKGLVSGLPPKRNAPFLPHGIFSTPGTPSTLVDTTTGLDVATPSLAALVQYATTPAFSPDGAQVAFINSDRLAPTCLDSKTCTGACLQACSRVLSVMDFDGKASPPAFSNLRDLVTGAGAGAAVAWPTVLPDGKGVMFHQGDSLDSDVFISDASPLGPQSGELRLVEMDKTVKTLN